MGNADPPGDGPPPAALDPVFAVERIVADGDRLLYYGRPLVAGQRVEKQVWPVFREAGYEVRLASIPQEDPISGVNIGQPALVAEPRSLGIDGIPWTNVITAVLTVLTTLWAGAQWYHGPAMGPFDLLDGWPFTVSVLAVLGVHELGHYVMSRYHGVEASLPYFIPIPSIIGTMGAVIRMRGRMPDRKALFDIGVAGPLAGLGATAVVTAIGLNLGAVAPPSLGPSGFEVNYPPLVTVLAWLAGRPLGSSSSAAFANPVLFAGWVGMFVTLLNLLPVGQLDGGHVLRAILGERQETIAALVPAALLGAAGYLYYIEGSSFNAVVLWGLWGVLTAAVAYAGPAAPMNEEPLGRKRVLVGIGTFVLGALCFTPVPIELLA